MKSRRYFTERDYQEFLARWLKRQGWTVEIEKTVYVANEQDPGKPKKGRIDIFAVKGERVAIFEVKPGAFTTEISQAVNQLKLYRKAFPMAECYAATPWWHIDWRSRVTLQAADVRYCWIGTTPVLGEAPPVAIL